MKHLHWALIYFAAALWFYFFSGMAEGLASPRVYAFLVFILAMFHSLYIIMLIVRNIFDHDFRLKVGHYLVVASLVAFLVSLKLGTDLDIRRTEETKRQGDQLLVEIQDFRDERNKCPDSLEELEQSGVSIPQPALKMSKFNVWTDKSGNCVLSFPATVFVTCKKVTQDSDWYCDD